MALTIAEYQVLNGVTKAQVALCKVFLLTRKPVSSICLLKFFRPSFVLIHKKKKRINLPPHERLRKMETRINHCKDRRVPDSIPSMRFIPSLG
jgi:hypothetical protein